MSETEESAWGASPADARQILIVRNPRAGSGARYEQFQEFTRRLTDAGFHIELLSSIEELEGRCREASLRGELRTIVAAGGDGTAELVANHMPHDVPLTVFPLGTENLLAKYLGMDQTPEQHVETIENGRTVSLDAARLHSPDGTTRLFLLMLGCGFDADVIHRLHEQRTGNITHFSYAKPILDSIRKYRYPLLTISCWSSEKAEPDLTIRAHWAFIFNTPSYAIGLAICPDADPRDGQLDMVSFHGGSLFQGLRHLGTVLLRRQRQSRAVEHITATRIRIESDHPVPFQVDGDPGGVLPVDVTVEPNRLHVIVPPQWRPLNEKTTTSYSQTGPQPAN